MLVRTPKKDERSARWRRPARGGYGAEHPTAAPETSATARERRDAGPSEDRALYTCQCGYAFEALVTTSVGCPHCAQPQAW